MRWVVSDDQSLYVVYRLLADYSLVCSLSFFVANWPEPPQASSDKTCCGELPVVLVLTEDKKLRRTIELGPRDSMHSPNPRMCCTSVG